MKKIRTWFLSGIAVILPLGVTIFALVWLFKLLDGLLSEIVIWAFGKEMPGVGLLLILIVIFSVGILTSNIFGKKIVSYLQRNIGKIPIVKTIYNPVAEIISGITSEKSQSFQKVVLVEFPMKGVKSIGFITNNNISVDNHDKVCVFIPTTPNPTNGFLTMIDKENVDILDISINEGLNMVVSIGSALQGNINIKQEACLFNEK